MLCGRFGYKQAQEERGGKEGRGKREEGKVKKGGRRGESVLYLFLYSHHLLR